MMPLSVVFRFAIVTILSLILFSSPGYGRTWRVEKDGSGDFAVIQNAVDAAAAGDTVLIGPGRYVDKAIPDCITTPDSAYVYITRNELTLIGSGRNKTIIGPQMDLDPYPVLQVGLYADMVCGFQTLTVRGIKFENIQTGVFLGQGRNATLIECGFLGNGWSVNASCDSLWVQGCDFDRVIQAGHHFTSYYQKFAEFDNCVFFLAGRQVHVQVQGTPRAKFLNCEFLGGYGGVNIVQGGRADIHNNQFSDQDGFGIAVGSSGGCVASVRDCEFSGQYVAFRQDGGNSVWEVESTTVTDVQVGTLAFGGLNGGYIRDSILAKGERYVVLDYLGLKSSATEPIHFDMTDNWWGTTDPDSIQALIFDHNDDPASGYIIDWQPFKSEPVPTEKKSLGSVKSMFR